MNNAFIDMTNDLTSIVSMVHETTYMFVFPLTAIEHWHIVCALPVDHGFVVLAICEEAYARGLSIDITLDLSHHCAVDHSTSKLDSVSLKHIAAKIFVLIVATELSDGARQIPTCVLYLCHVVVGM